MMPMTRDKSSQHRIRAPRKIRTITTTSNCIVSWILLVVAAAVSRSNAFSPSTTRTFRSSSSCSTPASSMLSSSSSLQATPQHVECLVVGSGISGSSLAFNLVHNHNISNVLLVEANDVTGGNLISKENDEGFVWEEGPNSFQPTPYICRLVHETNTTNDLVLADASLPRFVYWTGQGAGHKLANLHALPTNLPGDLFQFNLLTWPGKIRAGLGAAGLWLADPPSQEESIREFVTRHLGKETFERVIDPFVSGVYAGDPDALAMRAALRKIHRLEGLGSLGPGLVSGGLTRMAELAQEKKDNPPDPAWPTYAGGQLGSFQKGLQTLVTAIEGYLGNDRVLTSAGVKTLEKDCNGKDGGYKVTLQNGKVVTADTVCVTSPTRVTCRIASDLVPAAARLAEVYSPPVASVTMAYKKEWFRDLPGASPGQPLKGFGHLLPRAMGIRSLGTIWSSSLFPNRAPEGWELLLTYIGGARDTAVANMTDDELYEQVDADNHKILLRPDAPSGKRVGCRLWQTAIPQYRKGHLDILAALETDEAKCPGLYLGGNYRTGVAFGDCVQFGWTQAEVIADYLKTKKEEAGKTVSSVAATASASGGKEKQTIAA